MTIRLTFLLLMISFFANAQDIEQINVLMGNNKFREAKIAIDKYLQNPKKINDYEGIYYKGRIYNSLSRDTTLPTLEIFNLRSEAFNAFLLNQRLDKKDLYLSLEMYASYLDLYYGFYDLGARQFNSKNYDGAISSFIKALEVKDTVLQKKYTYAQVTLNKLDTSLILNIAASAIQAKKETIAIEYYKKLTDAGIAGADYKEIYEYMVDYYSRKKEEAALKAIIEKAKRLYPNSEAWMDIELKVLAQSEDKTALLLKYDELVKQNPGNFNLTYNYAVELYNMLYGRDAQKAQDVATINKLTEILKMVIINENEKDATANSLMANHLFNRSADLLNESNAIKVDKTTPAAEVKRKADLKAAANKTMDECIFYSESAVKYYESLPSKTDLQKANYKIALGYLSDIYSIKNNKAKADEYEKKNAAADKL